MVNNFNPEKYRYAAFDLDETLLCNSRLSEVTVKTLEALSQSGVEIIIATGRGLPFIPKKIKELPFVRYIVSACGACVTDTKTGETLWSAPIDKDTVLELLAAMKRHGGGCNIYYDGLVVTTKRSLRYMTKNEPSEFVKSLKAEFNIPVIWSARRHLLRSTKPAIKLDMYFRSVPELADCLKEVRDIEGLQFADSFGICLETTKKGVGKSGGLAALLEILGASPENLIAFGDGGNDIDMLEYAGFGVAMGSAGNALREKADYIALPATEDGAAKAIAELFSI